MFINLRNWGIPRASGLCIIPADSHYCAMCIMYDQYDLYKDMNHMLWESATILISKTFHLILQLRVLDVLWTIEV